tara:strand:- start:50127 stop:52385 length:2259 start_codon:yes stop_codon:yes gene_type:complete
MDMQRKTPPAASNQQQAADPTAAQEAQPVKIISAEQFKVSDVTDTSLEFIFESLIVNETFSNTPQYTAIIRSQKKPLDSSFLGHEIAITYTVKPKAGSAKTETEYQRDYRGVVTQMQLAGKSETLKDYRYQIQLAPKLLYVLQNTLTSNVFIKKSVTDIIDAMMQLHGFALGTDYRYQASVSKAAAAETKLDFYTQYKETDFVSLLRLMQQANLFYYVENTASGQCLVFGNSFEFEDFKKDQALLGQPVYGVDEMNIYNAGFYNDWLHSSTAYLGGLYLGDSMRLNRLQVTFNQTVKSYAIDGHIFTQPEKQLQSTPVVLGQSLSQHPHSQGVYDPELLQTGSMSDARELADKRVQALQVNSELLQVEPGLPLYNVGDKLDFTKAHNGFDQSLNAPKQFATNYIVTAVNYNINAASGLAQQTMTLMPVPKTQELMFALPDIPVSPVQGRWLPATVVDHAGKFDTSKPSTEMCDDYLSVYVGFKWDQALRGEEANMQAIPAKVPFMPGMTAAPYVGSSVYVQCGSPFETPHVVSAHYHEKQKPFKQAGSSNVTDTVFARQGVPEQTFMDTVNRLVFSDVLGSEGKDVPAMIQTAPGQWLVQAGKSGVATLQVSQEGEINFNNGKAAWTMKADGSISLAAAIGEGDNNRHTFDVTKDGMSFDTPGKFKINASNLELNTTGKLEAFASEIGLTARDSDLNIYAKGDVDIDTPKDVKVDAQGTISLKGKAVNTEGMEINSKLGAPDPAVPPDEPSD